MARLSNDLCKRLAQAICGDDHLVCSWPDCGCKVTKQKINAVALVVSEIDVQGEITGFGVRPNAE